MKQTPKSYSPPCPGTPLPRIPAQPMNEYIAPASAAAASSLPSHITRLQPWPNMELEAQTRNIIANSPVLEMDLGFRSFTQCLQEGMAMDSLQYSLLSRSLGLDSSMSMTTKPLGDIDQKRKQVSASFWVEKDEEKACDSIEGKEILKRNETWPKTVLGENSNIIMPSIITNSSVSFSSYSTDHGHDHGHDGDRHDNQHDNDDYNDDDDDDDDDNNHNNDHRDDDDDEDNIGNRSDTTQKSLDEHSDENHFHSETAGRLKEKEKAKKGVERKRRIREARVALVTRTDVERLDDGYRWRKYGQKAVKNSPFPRSYYRCTNMKCRVKKQIERSSQDPSLVVTTYEGHHNHHTPALIRSLLNNSPTTNSVSSDMQVLDGTLGFCLPHDNFRAYSHSSSFGLPILGQIPSTSPLPILSEKLNIFEGLSPHLFHQPPCTQLLVEGDEGLLEDMLPSTIRHLQPP